MLNRLFLLSLGAIFMTGCASGAFKARQEQREKLASSSGLYCEFVSGDLFPDLDVELNMRMAKRCDADRNYSITQYKNSSDQIGITYCCSMTGPVKPVRAARHEAAPVQRSEPKVVSEAPAAVAPVAKAPAVKPAPSAAVTPATQPQQNPKEPEEAIIGE